MNKLLWKPHTQKKKKQEKTKRKKLPSVNLLTAFGRGIKNAWPNLDVQAWAQGRGLTAVTTTRQLPGIEATAGKI